MILFESFGRRLKERFFCKNKFFLGFMIAAVGLFMLIQPDVFSKVAVIVLGIIAVMNGVFILYTARNLIIDKALGSYLYFMDSDDTIHPDTIKLLMGQINKYDADIAFGSYEKTELNGEKSLYQYIQEE